MRHHTTTRSINTAAASWSTPLLLFLLKLLFFISSIIRDKLAEGRNISYRDGLSAYSLLYNEMSPHKTRGEWRYLPKGRLDTRVPYPGR
jgi:hypothetical protein